MSKIICDVCGTSYPDTANQCPICGCVRTPENKKTTVAANSEKRANSGYTYVKGGRFSKTNVRKRMKSGDIVSVNVVKDSKKGAQKNEKNGERGLVATVIVLLLAIVAAVLYITIRYFVPTFISSDEPLPTQTQSTETAETTVACESISLDTATIKFEGTGQTYTLTAEVKPENTTDTVKFVSADETVASVDYEGNIATVTAVGEGKTTITVSCGAFSASCDVECTIVEETETTTDETQTTETGETTEPTDPSETTAATVPDGTKLELNREDITLLQFNEVWDLYDGDIPVESITWTTDNPAIATIENGVVKAVGVGQTTVYAEYNGQKVSCIIRCSF